MSITFIETNKLPRKDDRGAGEVTEVLSQALCGAKNGIGNLRWLKPGEKFKAEPLDKHQLIYLMDGQGRIKLDNKDYDVTKGAGIYLGPSETASIEPSSGTLKLFHLIVPRIP